MLTLGDNWLNIYDIEGISLENFPKGLNPLKHMLFKHGESIDGIGLSRMAYTPSSTWTDIG